MLASILKEIIKIAVVQATPYFFDNKRTLEKMEALVKKCSQQNCDVALFPESFLPGYPRGMTFGTAVGSRSEKGRKLWKMYLDNSIEVGDPNFERIREIARQNEMQIIIGITEKDSLNRSLYCTVLLIDRHGDLYGKHRKIKPTGSERIIWGEGDGNSLITYKTEIGRVGTLVCWENMMPEARLALYKSGIDLYFAPTADARPSWTASMQHIACEGRCFVMSANQYFRRSDYNDEMKEFLLPHLPQEMCRGGSLIVSPYGELLKGPLFDEEGIIITEINAEEIIKSRMDFDPVGHYSRPDLFEFRLKNEISPTLQAR